MLGKNTKVTLQGVAYDLVPLTYDDVVEALSFETLVDEWLLMVRVERENNAETK